MNTRRKALLVGVNDYEFLGKLAFARADADSFSQALVQCCGFHPDDIVLLSCAGRAGSRASCYNWDRCLFELTRGDQPDLFLFGFWGHGFRPAADQQFLAAADTRPDDLERTAIPLDLVRSRLGQIGSPATLVILDCCQRRPANPERGGTGAPLVQGTCRALDAVARDIVAVKSRRKQPRTTAIMMACSDGEAAYEWNERGHGVFTAHVLDGMGRGLLDTSSLSSYLEEAVPRTARLQWGGQQTPYFRIEGAASQIALADLALAQRQSQSTGNVGVGALLPVDQVSSGVTTLSEPFLRSGVVCSRCGMTSTATKIVCQLCASLLGGPTNEQLSRRSLGLFAALKMSRFRKAAIKTHDIDKALALLPRLPEGKEAYSLVMAIPHLLPLSPLLETLAASGLPLTGDDIFHSFKACESSRVDHFARFARTLDGCLVGVSRSTAENVLSIIEDSVPRYRRNSPEARLEWTRLMSLLTNLEPAPAPIEAFVRDHFAKDGFAVHAPELWDMLDFLADALVINSPPAGIDALACFLGFAIFRDLEIETKKHDFLAEDRHYSSTAGARDLLAAMVFRGSKTVARAGAHGIEMAVGMYIERVGLKGQLSEPLELRELLRDARASQYPEVHDIAIECQERLAETLEAAEKGRQAETRRKVEEEMQSFLGGGGDRSREVASSALPDLPPLPDLDDLDGELEDLLKPKRRRRSR